MSRLTELETGGKEETAPAAAGGGSASVESFVKQRMDLAIEALKKELANVRAGRPSSNILDQIQVNVQGTKTPLPRVAQVVVRDNNTLAVNVFDRTVRAFVHLLSSSCFQCVACSYVLMPVIAIRCCRKSNPRFVTRVWVSTQWRTV